MKLWLVRHGQTRANVEKRYSGLSETPLTDLGIAQAQAVSMKLAGIPFEQIFCSQLQRARQTAEIVRQQRSVTLTDIPSLNEISFGDWERYTAAELSEKYPIHYQAWCNDWQNITPPGGESFAVFNQRIALFIKQLRRQQDHANILIVSHQGVLRLLISQLLKLPPTAMWHFTIEQGAWSEMHLYDDFAVLQCLNNRA